MTNKTYRPNVVGVFQNLDGQVLVGKRASINAWQFPQGGVDQNETPIDALKREMTEELGCGSITIIKQSKDWIYYDFPSDLKIPITDKYCGQKQMWFLCKFSHIADEGPNLSRAVDKEFEDLKWTTPQLALEEIIFWKKQAYINGLSQLGLI